MTNTESTLNEARRLAALLVMATVENDAEAQQETMDEAYASIGLPALVAGLTEGLAELLVGTLGPEGAVANLNMAVNAAEMNR
ncbi:MULTISPECIES: hypothetical protein [Rhodococcus]|uniref:Uncharacterized protein n=1 Tax=Rhodococcus oxybenzonivorans TaxID=1990687 RepID=A0AAE4UUS2_9NOCA|nr:MULTISPECIES: hypothetical protein [Rhodococcus]MDV7245509.1 hypothetical protein [Rhodococcus oxybenzonivorans]MDV7263310.1 hypothetical protein [Rhodococcus oxybenzonivorans]MDV7276589.1 hypothetical protein [Rhodococcus oxybenzonivorans]MDV7336484.1 hypothetical protein [Rhodococcus oxybenzonivorans]MDV7346815.1 hypothetical protein [Rhodococcus oxybenzonivorans]